MDVIIAWGKHIKKKIVMLQQKAPGQGGGGAYPGILTKSLIDRGS